MPDPYRPQALPHTVLVAGERVPQAQLRTSWHTPQVQGALLTARQRFGHALCQCRAEPLKLQIRLRAGKLHLAVWPQERPAHDGECIFFHDEVAARAAGFAAPDNGASPVCLSHPAATPARNAPHFWGTGGTAPQERSACPLTVKSLAQRLWQLASLCTWQPNWIRDWGRTRYQLITAAGKFSMNGLPLEQLLFVPRPFRPQRAGMLNQEWAAFVRALGVERPRGPRLLIAPVRRVVAAHDGHAPFVFLRHLRDGVALAPACFDFIARDCRSALANSRAGQRETIAQARLPELIGFFQVEGASASGLRAHAAWLMAVHPGTYIPAANSDAVMLVDALVAGGYAFHHLISEAAPGRRTEPDWLVRHVRGPDGVPVARAALEVMAPSVRPDYLALRHGLAARMAQEGIPTWVWSPGRGQSERRVPQLPPGQRVPADQAARVLEQICDRVDADYRYGASSKFAGVQVTHP